MEYELVIIDQGLLQLNGFVESTCQMILPISIPIILPISCMTITHLATALPPPGTRQHPAIIVSKQGTLIIEIPQETPSKN